MFIRSRKTKARTDDAGDRLTVFQVAWIRPIAGFCCGLAVLTIFWRDWIETLTGYDPDQHDGTVECLIAIALLSSAPYWRSRPAFVVKFRLIPLSGVAAPRGIIAGAHRVAVGRRLCVNEAW
jgi:hypothetical protein